MEKPILMESSPSAIAPLILRNFLTSIFVYTDKSLLNLGERFKLLGFLRYLLVSVFFFFLGILPSLFPTLNTSHHDYRTFSYKFTKTDNKSALKNNAGDSSIARTLSQLLSIMNDIPVSSRKYETVRLLAEKVIDDNIFENCTALEKVNRVALSAAFSRTLLQLEARATMIDDDIDYNGGENGEGSKGNYNKLSRILRVFRYCIEAAWSRLGLGEVNRCGKSAEKLAAELLWIGQKLAKCGNVEEAVYRWASASKLAWLALSAESRLQCSLVKVSVFLFKQAKEMGGDKEDEEEKEKKEQTKQTKLKLLMSWLPLLCRASNGTDTPVLSFNEKAEVERVLEEIIESLSDKEQEKVLSLWLHHFIHCPTSDWPNLHDCYSRWCTTSRRLLIIQV